RDNERSTADGATAADAGPRILAACDPAANGGRTEIVFIEDDVADYQSLAAGIHAGVEVVLLDSRTDGLQQMANHLQERRGIDAIHVMSHGAEAQVQLGALTLDGAALSARSADLSTLG